MMTDDETPECPNCGGEGSELGSLGKLRHFRCRNCGGDFSQDTAKAEGPTYPTLHLNGSSGEALFEQACEALGAVRKTTDALCAMNPHGRDYYVQGPEALGKAQKAHNDRLQKLRDVRLELEAFAENVRDQIDARRR